MAQVLGVASSVLGILSFGWGLFGGAGSQTAMMRLGVGLNYNGGLTGAEGQLEKIWLFNENQEMIGAAAHDWFLGTGSTTTVEVHQYNTQQAAFAQIHVRNDAICLAMVSISWAEGAGNYGWVGDWGRTCGLPFYYSNYNIENSDRQPFCTWLDADRTNNFPAKMIMIHFPSFAPSRPHSSNPKDFCGWKALRAYDNNGGSIFKRDLVETTGPVTRNNTDQRLVVSSQPAHNATELCAHPNSWGPDFVSLHEGVFCDMSTSETLPLCGEDLDENCFHLDHKKKMKRNEDVSVKSYSDVLEWF